MAIARDNVTAGVAGTGTSLSWSHTVSAGCAITVEQTTGSAGGTAMTSVQWDTAGVNESLSNTVNTVAATVDGGNVKAFFWWKQSPTAGTSKTIKVTPSASCEINAGAESVSGWGGTFNAASPQTNTVGTNTNPTVTVTSATGEWVIDSFYTDNNSQSGALTQTGTKIYSTTVGTVNSNGGAQDKPGAATVTMNWTGATGTAAAGSVGVSLIPSASGPTAAQEIPIFVEQALGAMVGQVYG